MKTPQSWDDIKIYDLQRYADAEVDDSLEGQLRGLAAIMDCEEDELESMTFAQLKETMSSFEWMKEMPSLKKEVWNIDTHTFQLRESFDDLPFGDFIDLEAYMKEPMACMHKICAILMEDKWTNMKREEKEKLFQMKMPVSVAHPISVFFLTSLSQYVLNTHPYFQDLKTTNQLSTQDLKEEDKR